MYTIYFWCPAISAHLLPLFNELAKHPRVAKAIYIGQKSSEPDRQALGWETIIPPVGEIVADPSVDQVEQLVAGSPTDAIHIFYGIHWVKCIVAGLEAVLREGRRFGIFSEPRVLEGPKGLMRLAHSLLTERKVRRHAEFVLAIGAHGPRWFSLAGYDRARIFPAAYFLDLRTNYAPSQRDYIDGKPLNVVFVGRLERKKGFHLFLDAVPLTTEDVVFSVVGTGPLVKEAIYIEQKSGRLKYIGVLPMSKVSAFLRTADILVLPSTTTDDGWGAVISEGLAAGAAIVASSLVGGAICARQPGNGVVLSRDTAAEIASTIDVMVQSKDMLSLASRRRRQEWAISRLDQVAGARYLLSILDYIFLGGAAPPKFPDLGAWAEPDESIAHETWCV